jgi:uncharacterized protein (DUF927 family)
VSEVATISETIVAIKRTVEALHPSITGVEVRVLEQSAAPFSGCFSDAATLAEAAAAIEMKTCRGSIYLTINPIVLRAQMSKGRIARARSGSSAADSDVTRLQHWFLDFDPARATGIAATDAEKELARVQMDLARSHFAGLGWPGPIVADSGNGFHLFYPIDLPNDEPSRQLLKTATAAAAAMFTTASVKLDVSVSNPARITRLYGTVNRKGTPTPERPWRRSALLEVPAERVPLTVDQLTSFVHGGTTPAAVTTAAPQPHDSQWRGDAPSFDMPAFLAAANLHAKGPEDYNSGQRWVLDSCAFNPEHNRGEAAVFIDESGAPGFNCFHESCTENRGWAAFEKAVKAQLKNDVAALATIAALESREGWANTTEGLFQVTKGGATRLRLGSQLYVVARVRDTDSVGWGFALRWTAADDKTKDLVVSAGELFGDSRAAISKMVDAGYCIELKRGVQEALVAYINSATPPVELRVDRPGWHGNNFVMPDEVIGPRGGGAHERIHFASTSSAVAAYGVAGSLEEWRDNIGRYCAGNSRLALAVSAGFAGPLLRLTGSETGGVHLCGASSVGKSSALSVAGSVCGGGGSGYVRQWRATANGLEGIAVAHNDGLLVLDELGQIAGKEVSAAIYMLANQSGKARAQKDGSAAATKSWAAIILSSGELSLSAHANESGGAKVKAGAEVRLLTVAADAGRGFGLFEDIHGFQSPAEFSDHLKAKSKAIYGTPLRAFLRWLCENREQALSRVAELQELFGEAYIPRDASGEITRAAARFSLLASAGELATEAGVTGWVRGEATRAAGACFNAWLDERGSVAGGDAEAGVRQALSILEQHGARFQPFGQSVETRDRLGFKLAEQGLIKHLVLRSAFEDVICRGFHHKTVRDELIRRGYLVPGVARPGQQQVRLPGLGRQWVYVMVRPDDAFDAEVPVPAA